MMLCPSLVPKSSIVLNVKDWFMTVDLHVAYSYIAIALGQTFQLLPFGLSVVLWVFFAVNSVTSDGQKHQDTATSDDCAKL